ncbi:MAG TPA: electron transfer flavoprotein subunit beta/FixA family protein [Acidimicrobiales bacterium]
MNVAVLVKQIPDPELLPALDPDTFRMVRGSGFVIDDADRYGVEVALSLRDASGGGEVTAVSMTPGGETGGLRAALAMGVDKALVVSDTELAGTDALSTAKVLAAALARVAPDLVIAATESTDGYTGTVPVQIAELLGWPSISYATTVACVDELVSATRQTDAGTEDVECPLPVVVSVTAGIVEPRYPSMRGIMSAKSKPIATLSVADLGIDSGAVGAIGARQAVISATVAPPRAGGVIVVDEGDAHEHIIELLAELRLI